MAVIALKYGPKCRCVRRCLQLNFWIMAFMMSGFIFFMCSMLTSSVLDNLSVARDDSNSYLALVQQAKRQAIKDVQAGKAVKNKHMFADFFDDIANQDDAAKQMFETAALEDAKSGPKGTAVGQRFKLELGGSINSHDDDYDDDDVDKDSEKDDYYSDYTVNN